MDRRQQHQHHLYHIHGQSSRYTPLPPRLPPLPPAPTFLARDATRRESHVSLASQPLPAVVPPQPTAHHHHHQLHRRPDDGSLLYVSYTPSSGHLPDHSRFIPPVSPSEHMVFKAPQLPMPSIRVSERVFFHNDLRDAPRLHQDHCRSVGDVFIQNDVKRERVGVFEEGRGFHHDGRGGYNAMELREVGDVSRKVGNSGRKRPRWEEEFALGKGSFLDLIEDKEQRRIDSGASVSWRCRDPCDDLRRGDADSSLRPSYILAAEQRDAAPSLPRLLSEVTSSAGHSRSKMEMIRNSLTTESRNLDLNGNYIIKENHFTSRGHYDRFRWEEGVHSLPRRSPQQKPSILSRLQFGKPNWKRKRGHKMKSAASPLLDYQPSASSEFSQSRMDDSVELDVSFKSNVVLAKEIAATPLPSMPKLITGEALCTGRNVAWDASAFSGTATPRNLDGEAAATGTHKLKDVGEISANLNPEIKPNKQRRPKNNVKNRVSLSLSGTVKSLDKKLDSPRTSRNRVGNMTMSPSDVAQNSANLMGDKLASPQNVDASKCNIQRNMEKEILVGKVKATGKPTPTICKNRSQGMTIAEKCPEEKMTAVAMINSSDAELTVGENVSGSRITMKKVKKGTLVTEKAASKKKVLEKILDTSVSVVECVEGENVMEISNAKSIDEFDPSRCVVKSDELISTSATSTLKKKVPKGNKKKKLAASVDPLVGVDQLNEICKGQASSHDSAKEIEPLKETGHESISSSHLKQNHLEDGKNNIKSSETTEKVLSAPDSSSIILKNLEDSRVNVLSHSSDRKDSASVGLLDGKVMGRRDMEEDTLFPSLLDSHPTQQICEILSANSPFKDPVQSQELDWGSSSNSTSNGHNFMEVHDNTLRNEVYQESLKEAKVHSGPESASDCEDKVHLVGARNGSMQTPTHTDAKFQGKGQEVITLTSPLCGSTHPVLLKKAETSVAVRPSLMFSSQGTMALEHLEVTKATSPSNDVVPIRADIIKGTSKVNSAVGAVESRGSLDQCEDAGGEDNITCREGSESSIHLSDPCVISSPDTVYGRKVEELAMNFHDRENSLNASVVTGEMEKMGTGVHVLPIQAQDRILDPSLLMVVNRCEANGLHLRIEDVVPQSTHSMAQQVHCSVDSITAGHVDEGVKPFALAASENGSPMREELCLKELGQAFCDPLDDINHHHGSTVEKMEEESMRRNDSLFDPKASESEARDKGNSDALFSEKTQPQPTREIEKHLSSSHCATGKERLTSRKVGQKPGMSKMYPRQTSQSARSFKKPPSNSTRHNTWHRTENPAVSIAPGKLKLPSGPSLQRQSPKKLTKIHSSYIRKGNSLIRKSPSVIPSSHSYFAQSALKQITGPEKCKNISIEGKVDSMDRLNIRSAGTMSSFLERPKTPPLPLNSKLAHPSLSCSRVLMEDPREPGTEELASSSAETQHFEVKEENRTNIVAANAGILFEKETAQIKHSSSQLALAAGTDANSASVHTTEDPALSLRPLVFHYRRNRNKLIRDTSSSDSDAQKLHGSSKMASLKIGAKESCKTRLERVMAKTYKSSRFSLVWTLNGKQSENTGGSNLLKHRKVLPYLFPWKRTAYCGSVFAKGSYLDKHPSLLVRKLRLLRQKNAGYTISNNGFSLKMSGVRNIGGSSLKWSKSMEKRSRKTSEEVASAIVEHERKKRKQKGTAFTDAIVKKENSSQCERIFCVGAIHYKMDPSRRTLVRIPDEQTPVAAKRQPVLGGKMSIVPRRLSIGNDEYVRVGNGNQLVRDPKKLVRILANEKIRWSLHTARLRSIRKQRYCQFFTRFGRCNKEEGKCPYIHDPTKVAICTKFLKGLCSSPNCKLTHKVIPERMPDCSYFLEGLCTNTNCPYRHVNVNSKASVCEGFLRGYCRDGDECRKKHSYVCPQFEVSGRCPWGPACKLHHPGWANKKASRLQKKKRARTDKHTQGRYFGGVADEVDALRSLPLSVGSEAKGVGDIFFQGGRFADYISLDDNDDGDDDDNDGVPLGSLSVSRELYLPGPLSNDANVLIKPLRIMNR